MSGATETRLDEILAQLRRRPDGVTSSELADVLGVDASTIRRDLARLATANVGLMRRGRRYTVDFHRAQRPLRLTTDEILALYLACRLLSRYQGTHNQHAESAMRKLADAVRADATRLARYLDDVAGLVHDLPQQDTFQHALEVLTQAISEGRIVTLQYHDQYGTVSERRLHPYALEPYGETHGCYVIGFDETRGAMRTFRLHRIEAITLTTARFTLPSWFHPSRHFAEAWGIVWTGDEPQQVELHFSGDAAERVRESSWHPSQRLMPQPDGTCIVTFRVSAPREMKRWILQWGADVEVVTPHDLRVEIATEWRRSSLRAADSDSAASTPIT